MIQASPLSTGQQMSFYTRNPQNSGKPLRRVGFLEHPPVQRKIVIAFEQGFGIPIASLGAVKIAAIEMDRRSQAPEWVCYRVDHVALQRLRASLAKGLGAGGLDQSPCSTRHATPEDVVFSARVDADYRPHAVVMGHDRHHLAPDDV